jgi:hypothetical protein
MDKTIFCLIKKKYQNVKKRVTFTTRNFKRGLYLAKGILKA